MARRVARTITKEEAQQKREDAENAKKLEGAIKHLEEVEDITVKNYEYRNPKGVGDTISNVLSKFGVTEEFVEKVQGNSGGGCSCDKARQFLNTIFPYGKKEAPQSEAKEIDKEG